MAKKQLPDPLEIQRAEAAGFIFSEDKKILLNCTNKDITAAVIPRGIVEIGEKAFKNCERLTEINIPAGVTVLGEMAFAYCENLESAKMPNSVT